MSSEDLVAYLRARLDEQEQAAKAFAGLDMYQVIPSGVIDKHGATTFFSAEVYAAVIEITDSARVLADIEAKRRLLDLHVNQGSENLPACKVCDVGFNACGCVGWDEWPCETLKILVQPYSSRPDFNEDWRTP